VIVARRVGVTVVKSILYCNRMANERARSLRKRMSDGERRLWWGLRARQVGGSRFRRQHPIGCFTADFVCLEKRLIVEVDGGHHTEDAQMEHDARRDQWLATEGYRVLRIPSTEVFGNLSGVLDTIWAELQQLPSAPRHGHPHQERHRT
jgi:very-short-patch-repair endonuclease